MKAFQPNTVIFSQDTKLQRKLGAFINPLSEVMVIQDQKRFATALEQCGPSILWIDLRTRQSNKVIAETLEQYPETLIVAVGVPKSEPMQHAEQLGIFATQSVEADRHDIQALASQAIDHLHLVRENEFLKSHTQHDSASNGMGSRGAGDANSTTRRPLPHFSRASRNFEDVDALLDNIVEGVASSMLVSRAGVFALSRDHDNYSLRAGLRCLQETRTLEYDPGHPLVRWLEIHAHLVSRSNLQHVQDANERILLTKALDATGAEIIVPMHARGRIIGWLFVGHRSTGVPFTPEDLEELLLVADHSSSLLENALLYEEVAVQKTLAETVLHAMPTGLIAVSEDGVVRSFNNGAQKILDLEADRVLGQPVETLGSRMADILRRTLRERKEQDTQEWKDAHTQRSLAAQTRLLLDGETCLGAVVLVLDLTQEYALREKEEQLERTSFWTELAASMSHEVRNPLVAIKTFAQLLPERYEDAEFRSEFSRLVSDEVDRLNKIIEQINDFAHPPELEFRAVSVDQTIHKGLDLAKIRVPQNGVKIDEKIDKNLPEVYGDPHALAECFAQLITNAMEASVRRKSPQITIHAHHVPQQNGSPPRVEVSVKDNGAGIPSDIQNKVFSPFCTTKARGMGLGLPIVRRTIIDHNGQVDISTNKRGTEVTVTLPEPTASNGSNGSPE